MRTAALLLVGIVVGWAASGVDWTPDADAQETARNPEPSGIGAAGSELTAKIDEWTRKIEHYAHTDRYKLDAFRTGAGNAYYILDSATGRLWYGVNGQQPQLVTGQLPEK